MEPAAPVRIAITAPTIAVKKRTGTPIADTAVTVISPIVATRGALKADGPAAQVVDARRITIASTGCSVTAWKPARVEPAKAVTIPVPAKVATRPQTSARPAVVTKRSVRTTVTAARTTAETAAVGVTR